jgi:hypothetical protein
MADWQTRRYVPDSDEEDDGISTQSIEDAAHLHHAADEELVEAGIYGGRDDQQEQETFKGGQPQEETEYHNGAGHDSKTVTTLGSALCPVEVVHGTVPQFLQDDESEDELALLPVPMSIPAPESTAQPTLDKLFSDSSQPEQGGPMPGVAPSRSDGQLTQEYPREEERERGSYSSGVEREGQQLALSTTFSIPSSPLTEFTSSPTLDRSADQSPEPETAPQYARLEEATTTQQPVVDKRVLRHRKLLQIMPYTVETASYERTFRSGGYEPVKWQEVERPTTKQHRKRDQSPDSSYEAEETQEDTVKALSHTSSGPTPHDHGPTNRAVVLLDRSAVPNHATSGASRTSSASRQVKKRRKLKHDHPPKQTDKTLQTAAVPDHFVEQNPLSPVSSLPAGMDWEVPPSPSPSASRRPPSAHIDNGFRFPPGMTPPQQTQLQTPILTSEPRPTRVQFKNHNNVRSSSFSDDSDNGLTASPTRNVVESASAGSVEEIQGVASREDQGNDSASEGEAEIQRVRRRMKGVLPASWLRFDQKVKQKKSTGHDRQRRTSDSPIKPAQPGVARRILNSNHPASSRAKPKPIDTFVVSDDDHDNLEAEESPVRELDSGRRYARNANDNESPPLLIDDDEDMEDNSFDRMAPPTGARQHFGPRPSKMRKIDHGKQVKLFKEPSRHRSRQTKISGHVIRGRISNGSSKKQHSDLLSIIDVMDADQIRQAPDFLRVATRTSKSRVDQGRQSPSRKIIKLATREDTTEVNQTIARWKKNRVPRSSNSIANRQVKTPRRLPLEHVSGNVRQRKTRSDAHDALETTRARLLKERQERNRTERQQTIGEILDEMQSRPRSMRTAQDSPRSISTSREDQQISAIISSNLKFASIPTPAILEETRAARTRRPRKAVSSIAPVVFPAPPVQNLVMERFLEQPEPNPALIDDDNNNLPMSKDLKHTRLRRLDRKRPPRQIRITSPALQQNVQLEEEYEETQDTSAISTAPEVADNVLAGLAPYGSDYTVDFDIKPFPSGTSFAQDGILGGRLSRCLTETSSRNLARSRDVFVFDVQGKTYEWGCWTETAATELSSMVDSFQNGLQSDVSPQERPFHRLNHALGQLVDYLACHLSFLDQVDRASFVTRFLDALSVITECLLETVISSDIIPARDLSNETRAQESFSLLSMLSWQVQTISDHPSISDDHQSQAKALLQKCVKSTLALLIKDGISDFNMVLHAVHDYASLHAASAACMTKVESLVTCLHLIKASRLVLPQVWTAINQNISFAVPKTTQSARHLEQRWFNLFVLLPFFDIDATGKVDATSRFATTNNNWVLVLALLEPILKAYDHGSTHQSSTLNEYIRAAFGRCLLLMSDWRWSQPEPLLRKIYDFFSKNNLADLRNEYSHGTPRFLENLDSNPDLTYKREDRAFHVFLKILVRGIQSMRQSMPDKKIQSTVFRLTPNHNRSLPKDEALRHEDLAALRNHHSLLTVLYYASPPGSRPRLDLLRNLVHVENSHREACQINMRAWSNLVTYQLTQDESDATLVEFMAWYSEFLGRAVRLHKLARTEVEDHSAVVSKESREHYITSNQRQIEAVILDALESLRKAIEKTSSPAYKNTLLTHSLRDVLGMFDPKNSRINGVVVQALEVVTVFLRVPEPTGICNEDSQDYGEWPSFGEDDIGSASTKPVALFVSNELYQACHALLSDAFGSESIPSDALLRRTLTTWVALACHCVKAGTKSWGNYIGSYGHESWANLRNTDQFMLYTPMFHAELIRIDPDIYDEHRSIIYEAWITSLVTRESQLKFQNLLTNAILDRGSDEPLLVDLPFAKGADGKFDISIDEFRARRISLLSSLLSNMHESLDFAVYHNLSQKPALRREYIELLKVLMRTMKETYEVVSQGSGMRGAYVEFVQKIVSFLQQYTANILPVDRFFTDARTFPLPANDPTYVVGRLKSYALKLSDLKTAKQLVIFIQNVTERAVIDGQEDYLVEQIQTAMSGTFESGDPVKPTLRSYLIQNILPAYSELVLSTTCGWMMATPLYRSLQGTLETMLLDMDGNSEESLSSVLSMLTTTLYCIQSSATDLVDHIDQPRFLRVLTVYFAIATAALRPLDYCLRLDPSLSRIAKGKVNYLRQFAAYAVGAIDETYVSSAPIYDELDEPAISVGTASIRKYATDELKATLSKNWAQDGDSYAFVGSKGRKKIEVDLEGLDGERANFVLQARLFEQELGRLPSFARREDAHRLYTAEYEQDSLWV